MTRPTPCSSPAPRRTRMARNPAKDQVAFVGVGSTGFARSTEGRSRDSFAVEAAKSAILDAGPDQERHRWDRGVRAVLAIHGDRARHTGAHSLHEPAGPVRLQRRRCDERCLLRLGRLRLAATMLSTGPPPSPPPRPRTPSVEDSALAALSQPRRLASTRRTSTAEWVTRPGPAAIATSTASVGRDSPAWRSTTGPTPPTTRSQPFASR